MASLKQTLTINFCCKQGEELQRAWLLLKCHCKLLLLSKPGGGMRENNAVVCKALRCFCSVPVQLSELKRNFSRAAVTFVNENMASPEFGQNEMFFLRVTKKKKKSLA